jgi:iron(III) transport system permease protein
VNDNSSHSAAATAGIWTVRHALTALCLVLALPVLSVLAAWLWLDAAALAVLRHQWQTVLPDYVLQSALLAGGVGLGVLLLGSATAAAVTLFDFPLRRHFRMGAAAAAGHAWPMCWPTPGPTPCNTSGPLQAALRQWLGLRGALWPDVRSLARRGGAVSCCACTPMSTCWRVPRWANVPCA